MVYSFLHWFLQCVETYLEIYKVPSLAQSGNLWGEKLDFTVFEKMDNNEHLVVYQKGSKYKGIMMASHSKAW